MINCYVITIRFLEVMFALFGLSMIVRVSIRRYISFSGFFII